MPTFYNRGKARVADDGWSNLDVRALVLADADVLPAGANDTDLNTVAELLAVAGVTEAANVSGTGYARQALGTETVVEDDAANVANLDAADLAYVEVDAGRWVAVVLYVEGASDAARDLVSLHDLEDPPGTLAPLVTNGGNVTLVVDTAGLIGIG